MNAPGSAAWRATPTDRDLFDRAVEQIILLYKPVEEFGVGVLHEGWIDNTRDVLVCKDLDDARMKLEEAKATNPDACLGHRIDPGCWVLHEGD